MAEEPIIRGIDAHKTYNSGPVTVHALRGVNLEIPRGEMVAIMGPSGCGKTTLLNCFSGLDDLTSGDVQIEGVSLSGMDDDAKSRHRSRRMGFVFQSYNLLPVLTAAENVELPLLVAKVPAKDARRKALVLMEQVELNGWAGHKPAQLSAGQQQRVAIARALVNDPAIVCADEPTANLDSETSAQIMDLLVRLHREQRQTLVLVTHDAIVSSRPIGSFGCGTDRSSKRRGAPEPHDRAGASPVRGRRRHRPSRPPARHSASPRTTRGAEHPTPDDAGRHRDPRAPRRHGGHFLQPRRRRYIELHLPRRRLCPARCHRRHCLERVRRPTLLVRGDEPHPDSRGPDYRKKPGGRNRSHLAEGDAGPKRRGQQGKPADHDHGDERLV